MTASPVDRALLNKGYPGSTWGNLGLWTNAQNYPAACEALAARLAQRAQLRPGSNVLDVGFGHGDQLLLWKQRFGAGPITGIEVDPEGITAAQRKVSTYGDVALQLGTGYGNLPPKTFDHVLALDCAYHFAPRSAFLAHAHRVLHPGGVLALTDLVLAGGNTPAAYAHVASLCGIPPENLLTQEAYAKELAAAGFTTIGFELLDAEVLVGFVRFVRSLRRQRGLAMLGLGGLKILATAAIIEWLVRDRIHYVLVTAKRPE